MSVIIPTTMGIGIIQILSIPGLHKTLMVDLSRFSYFVWETIFEPRHEIMVLFVLCKFFLQMCMRNHPMGLDVRFLAHLSRRFTRWAYSIPMVHRPSVVVVVHTFKLEYLWSQLANFGQILCVASLGWGKGSIMFWGRLDQNSGFHGNRKPPLTYNGENDVSTFSRLFWIRSFLYLQVTRTCIKSRTSSNFNQIGPLWS